MKRVLTSLLIVVALVTGGLLATLPARAASPGTGFGEWAPSTRFGWHGSMLVDGIHTYCIFPGRPLPTGPSEDRGISGDAAGLDPQRLTAINMLVSTYGQTDDPVQAAGVGWAVKAISDWDTTLHTFGYPGDTLQGAIDWVFRHIAPEHNVAVQNLAAAYYAEAMALPTGPAAASGSLQFATDADAPLRGTVTVVADLAGARGSLALENAVFADSGQATLENAVVGGTYPITVVAPPGETTVTVRGTGTFRGAFRPAVHHFVTAGGQDTAGPAGPVEFPVAGEDTVPRNLTFAPTMTTQVLSRYVAGGAYTDDVAFDTARGTWARTSDGGYVPVRATATLYRTPTEPALSDEIPAEAEDVGRLELTTDPTIGPTAPYRVESDAALPGPGFYTAVWRIDADGQPADTRAALPDGYRWQERFGEQSQVTMVAAVSSRADGTVAVGARMGDEVIVDGVLPTTGLVLSASVYRVPEGTDPATACTAGNLLWAGPDPGVRISAPGSARIEGPIVPDFGTYVWVERAADAEGRLVHEGACGVEDETTRAPLPTVETRAFASVGWGGAAVDTAVVRGPIPQTGTTALTFEVYRAPADVDPGEACTPETRVADTADTPVPVDREGEFTSPAVRLHEPGTHYWVERLHHTTDDGDTRVLAEGTCGLENETTVVEQPAVRTLATERAALDEPFHDTATVTGLGDGVDAELVFSVFHGRADAAPVCGQDELEAVTAPVPVAGSGEVRSPSVRSSVAGAKYWVAELRARVSPDAEPVVLHTGTCGEDGETTYVDVLAVTGTAGPDTPVRTIGGVGALVIAAGLSLIAWTRRRRSPVTP